MSEVQIHRRGSHGDYNGIEMVLEKLSKTLQEKEALKWVLEHKKDFEW